MSLAPFPTAAVEIRPGEVVTMTAMTRAASTVVAARLRSLLGDTFTVDAAPSMGFDGINVARSDTPGAYWYFDTTFGGDDGHGATLRVYYTDAEGRCSDEFPPDSPTPHAHPDVIASWIAGKVIG